MKNEGAGDLLAMEQSQLDGPTAHTSVLDPGLSKISGLLDSKRKQSVRRAITRSPMSRYRHIMTENIKFNKFLDVIFKSKLERLEIKEEISKYI